MPTPSNHVSPVPDIKSLARRVVFVYRPVVCHMSLTLQMHASKASGPHDSCVSKSESCVTFILCIHGFLFFENKFVRHINTPPPRRRLCVTPTCRQGKIRPRLFDVVQPHATDFFIFYFLFFVFVFVFVFCHT